MTSCAQCRAPIPAAARNCPKCGITLSGADFETYPGTGAHAGSPANDAMIGRWVLDQYQVKAKLGEGGMGAVYLADQPAIGRQAVIKIIHPWLSRDPQIAARFATEAKAAARLQNPHIVSIYNYGRMADGTLFLAMEHLAGRTLAQLLRAEGRLDTTRAVAITTQACEALGHAHARGVIHRDLKPSNIMLVARDRGPEFVKVLDFGIAKLDGGEGTATGAILGTPQYMSPEQLTGRPVDSSTDLYSLGVVLYEMLTGRPPFVADNAIAYIHKHTQELPAAIALACPGVRVFPAVEACLMRALAKAPHQRPQAADIFADELWSALMATVDSSHVPMPRVRPPAPPRAAVAVAVALGVAAVFGAGTAGYLWLRSETPPPTDASIPADATPPTDARAPAAPPVVAEVATVSPEKAALLAKPISELEAELQRATVLSALPRERIELALQEYQIAVSHPPAGQDAAGFRRALLVDLIVTWRQLKAEGLPPDRRVDELEAIFLTMPSSYSVQARRDLLLQLKTANADAHGARADEVVYRRLIEWIADFGEADAPIEIFDDEQPE